VKTRTQTRLKEKRVARVARSCDVDLVSASGEILTWEEVNRTHRIRNGVYQRGGRLVSLLTDFGRINSCYPDVATEDGDRICYVGDGRHGDQRLTRANRALLDAIDSGHAVPLFNKLAVGRWQLTGFWRVTEAAHRFDEKENRMLWRFTLVRVSEDDGAVACHASKGGRPDLVVKPL
jgi:hypothetical protein